MELNFKVDQDRCTNCKKCVSDCPVLIINGKTPFPEIKEGKEGNCLKCQHCLAVCPEGAISILGNSPEDSISIDAPVADSEGLANLMKLRRSTRRFAKVGLERELIHDLMIKASYAPTAKNENAVQMTVVDSREQMLKLRELTYEAIKQRKETQGLPSEHQQYGNFQKLWDEKKIDVLFRNAPHILIVSNPISGTLPEIDATITLTYFDLLANSQGISTLWDGFATSVIEEVAPELKSTFGIPDDHKVVMALLFGKAGVKYARSIQNEIPNLKVVSL